MIYAFSAYNLDGHRVLVLVDWYEEQLIYPSAATQAGVENYDKHYFHELDYCPVWAEDAYKVHRRWLELKAHIPFEIMFPFVINESVLTTLKVARIVRDHDPFKAYAFQWGEVRRQDIGYTLQRESKPRYVRAGDKHYHIGRIAWLAHHRSLCADPIDIYVSATRRLFVENGNHRLAAAIVRGDDEIRVKLYGHGIYSVGENGWYMIDKWDKRFLRLAIEISTWSKDPKKKVGCVIVSDDRTILATGYNGFPRGVEDDGRLQNKQIKLEMIVHAEKNACAQAARHGPPLRGATCYVTHPVCAQCASMLIQVGIKRVVVFYGDANSSWAESCALACINMDQAGVIYEHTYYVAE